MYDILIIGGGVTGLLVLSSLQKEVSKIAIIDPYFDGGDLIQKYGGVQSNTPLSKTVNALKLLDPSYDYSELPLDKTAPLYVHAKLIQDFIKPKEYIQDYIESLSFDDKIWTLKSKDSTYLTRVVILCQGSDAKILNCGIPTIRLEDALNKDSLKKLVRANDNILLFGTSHSGTLILENLEDLKVNTTAIYKNKEPFLFAKDGVYDGIKEDAEFIATRILNNEFKYVKLLNLTNVDKLIKVSKKATKAIYAIGFKSRGIKISYNGEDIDSTQYNNKTGSIHGCEGLWGFGIAYPSSAPDDIHVDVGIISFIEHILKQVIDIKNYL